MADKLSWFSISNELFGEVYFRAKKAHEDAGSHSDLLKTGIVERQQFQQLEETLHILFLVKSA